MAVFSLDINSLYEKAFGLGRGKDFDGEQRQQYGIAQTAYDLPNYDLNGDSGQFSQIRNRLMAHTFSGMQLFMPVRIGGVLLPNEPTMSVSIRKNIVETALVGSTKNGTVKELIALEDYELVIRGIALNEQSKKIYPEDMVVQLHKLFRQNEGSLIESGLTEILGIHKIVIKSFSLPEMSGVQHAQAYEFQCVSDSEFILDL
jgi:Domain of unknown function (DUF6046)